MASTKLGNLYRPDLDRSEEDQIWFRYSVNTSTRPKFEVHAVGGALLRTLDVGGVVPPGEYSARGRAMFWDRDDSVAARVGTGTFFVWMFLDGVIQTQLQFGLS